MSCNTGDIVVLKLNNDHVDSASLLAVVSSFASIYILCTSAT
jgi:hypothetical protein